MRLFREHGLEAVGSKVPGGSSLKPVGGLAQTVFVDGNLVPEWERSHAYRTGLPV
jgi:hypothetical protein